jgi:hypothetical protein
METPEGLETRLSLLIDWICANRTSSRLVFASGVSSLWTDRKRREALTVVALGKPLAARATLDERHMMESDLEFKWYFWRMDK